MTSTEGLIKRAHRLAGGSDDALEAQWDNVCAQIHESMIRELEEQIERMTPEEMAEEAQNSDSSPFTPEEEAELEEFLSRGAAQAKQMYFQNARKGKRKR